MMDFEGFLGRDRRLRWVQAVCLVVALAGVAQAVWLAGNPEATTEFGLLLNLTGAVLGPVLASLLVLRARRAIAAQCSAIVNWRSAIRTTEDWYRGILEASPDGTLIVDEDGRVLLASGRAESMFGVGPGALIGVDVETLVPLATRLRNAAWRSVASGGEAPVAELEGVRADGLEFPCSVAVAMLAPGNGLPSCMCLAVRDVSRRRQVELRLELLADEQEALIANAPIGILFAEGDRMVRVNPALAALFGYARETALDNRPLALLFPDQGSHDRFCASIGQGDPVAGAGVVQGAGARRDREWTMRRADGSDFLAEVRVKGLRIAGRRATALWMFEDITARKHAEAALREAEARQTYALTQARRYEKLFAAHAVSEEAAITKRQESQIADAALSAVREDLARAHSDREALIAQRSNLRLIAPVDGVVALRDVDPGTTIVAGQAVVEVIDRKSLCVNVRFDQIRASGLAAGLPARIVLRSHNGRVLNGRVLRLEPKADAVTEETLAKVVFDAQPEPLPPVGELAEVTVDLPALPAAPVIPNAVVRREGDRTGVWQVVEGNLRFVPVKLGASDLDGLVQVREGLGNGARVVAYSEKGLTALSRIHVVERIPGVPR